MSKVAPSIVITTRMAKIMTNWEDKPMTGGTARTYSVPSGL